MRHIQEVLRRPIRCSWQGPEKTNLCTASTANAFKAGSRTYHKPRARWYRDLNPGVVAASWERIQIT